MNTKLKLVLTVAVGFGLAALVVAAETRQGVRADTSKPEAPESANRADNTTSRDVIAECAKLAPEDPYEAAVGNDAYVTCKAAAKAAPKDPDTQYRFGLAAIQVDQLDEAVATLKEAASLGHCGANYFLGEKLWRGDKDAEAAEEYYDEAASCGDVRAKHQVFGDEFFAQSAYPAYLKALYNSDIPAINETEARFVTASYVAGFYEAMSEQFLGRDFDPCWTATYYRGGDVLFGLQAAEKGDAPNVVEGWLYAKSLPLIYQVFLPAQGNLALEERRNALRKAGHADAIRMVTHAECGALAPHKLLAGVTKYAEAKVSLRDTVRNKYPEVHSLEDFIAALKGKDGKGY